MSIPAHLFNQKPVINLIGVVIGKRFTKRPLCSGNLYCITEFHSRRLPDSWIRPLFSRNARRSGTKPKTQMNSQTPEQARQMYEQALALAPDDVLLQGNFEQFLEATGDLPGAIAEAKRG